MPTSDILSTPTGGARVPKPVFEYLAFVRDRVENAYMGFNTEIASDRIESAIMKPFPWIGREFPPRTDRRDHAAALAALVKLRAYLDLLATSGGDNARELQSGLEASFPLVYAEIPNTPSLPARLAVYRISVCLDEDGQPWWEYTVAQDGEKLPGVQTLAVHRYSINAHGCSRLSTKIDRLRPVVRVYCAHEMPRPVTAVGRLHNGRRV